MKIIDLRSDTVTNPSIAMKQAMLQAELGDDVFGEDPTVNKLQTLMAEKLGFESALFVPSGTQSNLIGIMMHCQRGDEYLVGQEAHTYKWEGGGAAVLGSIQPQPVHFESDGSLNLAKLEQYIKPLDDHHSRTTLLCLENTQSGKVLSLDYLAQAREFCNKHKLLLHLDGARVFNASVKLKVDIKEISQYFDSVSVCLSKGLGAPVGSVLCGSKDKIREGKRWRKVLGGGMRQAGLLAAAGIYALEHNINRLQTDHDNAEILAHGLHQIDEIEVALDSLQTNIFYIKIAQPHAISLASFLKEKGIIIPKGEKIRLVTHLDVSQTDVEKVINEFKNYYKLHQSIF